MDDNCYYALCKSKDSGQYCLFLDGKYPGLRPLPDWVVCLGYIRCDYLSSLFSDFLPNFKF